MYNDCDGVTDIHDDDCWISNCDRSGDVGLKCEHNNGDQADDVNSDGFYCDLPSGYGAGRCCRTGQVWTGSSCQPAPVSNCNPSPCNYDIEDDPSGWWGDPGCYTAGTACCYQGTEYGEEVYEYESNQAY